VVDDLQASKARESLENLLDDSSLRLDISSLGRIKVRLQN
jgi:hypothetical protein